MSVISSPSNQSSDTDLESFLAISIKSSPGLVRQGNLTGSARKLKDGAADLHNLVERWNTLHIDGTNIVNEIARIKLDCILSQSEEAKEQPNGNLLPESLLPLCEKMTELLKRMLIYLLQEKVVLRLSGLADRCHGVAELESHNKATEDVILFQAWDVKRFESTIREVTQMYQKELELKKSIAESICHGKDRNTVMFYIASWVHQPYIENKSKLLVESMLLETKHK